MAVNRIKRTAILFGGVLATTVTGFMAIEGMGFLDAVYLSVLTVATVGYGDITPVTDAGKLFTVAVVIVGVGLTYYVLSLMIGLVVEGQLQNVFGRRGMEKRIAAMENHIIVCGAGKVGSYVVERLRQEKESFVVIELAEDVADRLKEKKVPTIRGDATLEETLMGAGVARARGVITALSHDADNVYVVLTAKSLKPGIHIVARADRPEAEGKLRKAGANTVIFPAVMGGRQLVSAMTRPVIMDFVENVFYNQELHLDIAEIRIGALSPLTGMSLAESAIKDRFESIVVAIKRADRLITNPAASTLLEAGDILVALGHREHLSALNETAGKEGV